MLYRLICYIIKRKKIILNGYMRSKKNINLNNKTINKIKDSKKTINKSKVSIHQSGFKEIGGKVGPDPTRYGDWEIGGRCSDF